MNNQNIWLDMAGIPVQVSSEGALSSEPGILAEYHISKTEPVWKLQVDLVDHQIPPEGECIYRSGNQRIYGNGDHTICYMGAVTQDPGKAYMRTVRTGTQIQAHYLRKDFPGGVTAKKLLNALDVSHLLTVHQGILLHASFIAYQGKAILFTAPSETGKSTQARLWCEEAGAELVNGDRAAVRMVDGQVLACGIPYSGSSPVRRNVKLPLGGIVYLSQAPENAITRLRGVRAFRAVWEGCTVNAWDRADTAMAMDTVARMTAAVPVWHLACTPDSRAVALLKNTMEVEA